jgi:hypothetical protein
MSAAYIDQHAHDELRLDAGLALRGLIALASSILLISLRQTRPVFVRQVEFDNRRLRQALQLGVGLPHTIEQAAARRRLIVQAEELEQSVLDAWSADRL